MITFTIDDIMREEPCEAYTPERVESLWEGKEGLTPLEIARLPISKEDRVWVLGRLLFRLSTYRARRVSRAVALDVIDRWYPPDIVVWYLATGDGRARDAARSAAWASAIDDAWDAARAAAFGKYLSWIVKAFDPFTPIGDLHETPIIHRLHRWSSSQTA